MLAETELCIIVVDTLVWPVLFVDLKNPSVLVIRRRKDLRRLPLEKNRRVSPVPIGKSADEKQGKKKAEGLKG